MICLDSNCVIYLIENNPVWNPKIVRRLAAATAARDTFAVCDLARAECMVAPLRNRDAAVLADYQRFFSNPSIRMLPLTAAVCERAAALRVATGMQLDLPDCLHLAAAIEHGGGLFLTNDAKIARCTAIPVEVLT